MPCSWRRPILSNSRTSDSDILLLRQPVDILAIVSSSILNLFCLGGISQSRVLAWGLWEGPLNFDWEEANVNLSLTAARSSRGKTLGSFQLALYDLWGQFCEYLGCQWIFSFSGKFSFFCHEFTLILKSKWRDLNSRFGGCGICASEIYFSNFLENKEEKTEVTLSLILWFNLRLWGYSIWSASTSRTIYNQDFGLEHLTASEQPEVLGRLLNVSERRPRSNQKDVLSTWSTRRCPAKYSTPVGLGYEELGGLSNPGQRDCL